MIPVAIGSLVVSCYGDLFTLWCRYSLMTWSWKPYNMLLSVDLWSSTRLLAWPTTQVKRKLCKGKSIAATPQSSYPMTFTWFHIFSHGSSMRKKPLVYSGLASAWSALPDAFFIQHPAKIFEDLATQGAHFARPNPTAQMMWIADNGPWVIRLIRRNGNGRAYWHKYTIYPPVN